MFAVPTTRLLLVALFAAVAAVLGTASAEELIAIDVPGNDLYRLRTDDLGSPVLLGHVSVGTDLSGLVVAGPDRLYTFDRDGNSLITVSASDASVLSVVALDRDCLVGPRGFDLSPGGVLYGVFGGMELRTVDPSTGQTTLVAGISGAGAGMLEALAFSPGGTLYSVGSDRLFTLDPETAVLSLIGSLNVSDIDCLTYGLDGFLYGTDSLVGYQADLYRIDPVTAHLDIVGNTAVYEVNGIAAVAPVPEPATLSLLVVAGIGAVRRQRRK
jgi:hypothetical protein